MSNAVPVLIIRADASVAIGTGHIMRMIALGQAWQEKGGEVVFLCAAITPALEARLKEEHFSVQRIHAVPGSREDLLASTSLLASNGSRLIAVALDGYQFTSAFQAGLKETGFRLLVVDDYGHADAYHADFVLNQNISAHEKLYSRRDEGTQLLLGPNFALLRQEFMDHRSWLRFIPNEARKLLVTLGGADADNVTKKVIDALAGSGLEARVVVGGSNPHLPGLRQAAEAASAGETRVELVVNASDMPSLMQWADMAVAAGGSTCWELAFTGLPSLFIILAENQKRNAQELERQGFGLCVGEHSILNKDQFRKALDGVVGNIGLRSSFASQGRAIVDGGGAARVADALAYSFCSA